MRSGSRLAALAALALAVPVGCGEDAPDAKVTLVGIEATGCSLSPSQAVGFVVAPSTVVTVAHAVQGADAVTVDGRPARLVALDLRADVAVLRVGVAGAVQFAEASPGDQVWAELPEGTRAASVLRTPTIEHTVVADDVTYSRDGVILDLAVRPRQSGSPVVDVDGRVVAMVYARSTEDADRAYAIAASELAATLAAVDPAGVEPGEC